MRLTPRAAGAACVALAAAAFAPTLVNGFTTWDDPHYILENPLIRSLTPKSVFTLFVTPEYAGNYHPLTLLALAIQRALFGDSPFGYHLVSLLLHLGVTFLAWRFTLRLTGRVVAALAAGLLFGLHPLHVEPVAWLSDQKDLLYSLFFLTAADTYLRTRDEGDAGALHRRVLPLFLLALLSKALAVTLPLVLLLIDWHRDGGIGRRALLAKVPLFALSLLFGVIAVNAQASAGAVTVAGPDGIVEKFLYASAGYVLYIAKLAVPFGLSPWYPYHRELPAHYWAFPVIAALIAYAALRFRRRFPEGLFGLAWYTVTVAPVLQLLQVGNAAMADRYAYLPSLGILVAFGVYAARRLAPLLGSEEGAGADAGGRSGAGRRDVSRARTAAALLAIYVLTLGGMSAAQAGIWRDGTTLWTRVVERHPDSPAGWFNRGYARHAAGRFAEAVSDYDRALSLNPAYPHARYNRGLSLFFLGRKEQALGEISAELAARPGDIDARYWRGNVLASLGRPIEAAREYAVVLDSAPDHFEATVRRGLALTAARDFAAAERDFDRAISLRPGEPNLHFNRANVRAGLNRWDDAIADYSAVLRSAPGDRDAFYARGVAFFLKGDTASACADLARSSAFGLAAADTLRAEICGK